MATVPVKNLKPNEVAELACTYAALILHDEDIDISGDKLSKLINAAGVQVEAFWPKLFAKALEGRSIADFFGVSGGDDAPAAAAPAATPAAKEKQPAKKQAKKEEPKKQKPAEKPAEPAADDDAGGIGDLFG